MQRGPLWACLHEKPPKFIFLVNYEPILHHPSLRRTLEPHRVQFQSLIYAGWLRFHELILAQIFAKLKGLKAATLQLVSSSESSFNHQGP